MTETSVDGRAFPSLSRNKARKSEAKQTIKLMSNIAEPVLETCSLERESCEAAVKYLWLNYSSVSTGNSAEKLTFQLRSHLEKGGKAPARPSPSGS